MSECLHLFPTPVLINSIGTKFSSEELEHIKKLKRNKNKGNTRSLDAYVLRDRVFDNIKTKVESALEEYKNNIIVPNNELTLTVTQSWVNWTKTDEYHHAHRHPNSFISGVVYINATEEDSIKFTNPQQSVFDIPPKEFNMFNSLTWELPVKTGDIIIFPSTLIHEVAIKKGSKDERVSLAFNVYPNGIIGDNYGLTELIL